MIFLMFLGIGALFGANAYVFVFALRTLTDIFEDNFAIYFGAAFLWVFIQIGINMQLIDWIQACIS